MSLSMVFSLSLWILYFFIGARADTGYFWHVTDFHYDHTYWTSGLSCNGDVPRPGNYGDYWCDSPWNLVQDSINSMADIMPDVDFIIWTGDNVAHIKDAHLTLDTNMEILNNITMALNSSFPSVPIYASLGNHDFYPSNQAESHESEMYKRVADMWESWIGDPQQIQLFRKGGYYKHLVQPEVLLLALNTNLYFHANLITENMTDPADQFAWMTDVLEDARTQGQKVIVTAHIPPGLKTPDLVDWFWPEHKKTFLAVVHNFSDVITSMHFGHDHSDGFKILQNDAGGQAVVQFTAPSVTPWRYKIPGKSGAPHNPGVRLIKYDRTSGFNMDYDQYYMNLTDSNDRGAANWTRLYNFQKAYGVSDMGVASIKQILDAMKEVGSAEALMYCRHSLVSNYPQKCTDQMQAEVYCGGFLTDLVQAKQCVGSYISEAWGLSPAIILLLAALISYFSWVTITLD